jgi:hypothetical protein
LETSHGPAVEELDLKTCPPIAPSRPQEFNSSRQFLFHAIALCQTSSSLVCLPEEVEMVLILIGGFGTHII